MCVSLLQKFFQFDVNFLDRQSHDVVERTVDLLDGGVADPLLNAVGPRLVVGCEGVEVVADLSLIHI